MKVVHPEEGMADGADPMADGAGMAATAVLGAVAALAEQASALPYTSGVAFLLLLRLTVLRRGILWLIGERHAQPAALRSIRRRALHWICFASLCSTIYVVTVAHVSAYRASSCPKSRWPMSLPFNSARRCAMDAKIEATAKLMTIETALASAISSLYGYSYASGVITNLLVEPILTKVAKGMVKELGFFIGREGGAVVAAFSLPLLLGLYVEALVTIGYYDTNREDIAKAHKETKEKKEPASAGVADKQDKRNDTLETDEQEKEPTPASVAAPTKQLKEGSASCCKKRQKVKDS